MQDSLSFQKHSDLDTCNIGAQMLARTDRRPVLEFSPEFEALYAQAEDRVCQDTDLYSLQSAIV